MNVQFGCGENRLPDWSNYNDEVDIAKPLPFDDGRVNHILIEHCLEHVSPNEAMLFLEEARRILVPGGVIRVVVPSVSRVFNLATDEYCAFVKSKRWGDGTRVSTVRAIMMEHGHRSWWTAQVLEVAMTVAGFATERSWLGESRHAALVGVDGHPNIIGKEFAKLESVVVEGVRS